MNQQPATNNNQLPSPNHAFRVYFRFYASLSLFLPAEWRQTSFAYSHNDRVSVKHLIESIGVPHTEVEMILVNGRSVDFNHIIQPEDRVSVYPAFSNPDIVAPMPLRPPVPQPIRFVLDGHLGQLARHLRLLGFDTFYRNHIDDEELAQIAHDEQRVLLTRDRGLLKRNRVVWGYCLHTREPEQQLTAVLHRFQLYDQIDPWQRCLKCNGRLHPVDKAQILDRLEPKTKRYYDEFQICADCEQIYWKGSHYEKMQAFLADLLGAI